MNNYDGDLKSAKYINIKYHLVTQSAWELQRMQASQTRKEITGPKLSHPKSEINE